MVLRVRQPLVALLVVDTTIPFGVGDAVAAGSAFALNQTIPAGVGNAAAAGSAFAVNEAIALGVGNAVGVGSAFAINESITHGIGNAIAAGNQVAVNQAISAGTGNATAAGSVAAVTQPGIISANIGNALAGGPSGATVSENTSVVALVGNATAAGQTFAITGNVSLNCTVGDANAAGQQCQVLPPLNVAPIATPGYQTKARYRVRVGKRWVEVDPLDQVSVRRAYDLAQEDAEQVAEQNVEQPAAVAKQAVVVQPIKGPDYAGLAKEARRISEEIRKVYADALQTALIARLMREQLDQDDEDDVAVLLASI